MKFFNEAERLDEDALPAWMQTREMRRTMNTLKLKFPAFPGGYRRGGGSGGGIFEGFAEIHTNPYENFRPQIFGPARVSELKNFRLKAFSEKEHAYHAYQARQDYLRHYVVNTALCSKRTWLFIQ